MRLTELESIYSSRRSSSVVVVKDVVRWKWKQEPLFSTCNLNHTDVRDLSHPPAVIVTCRVLSRNLVRNACTEQQPYSDRTYKCAFLLLCFPCKLTN